MLLYSLKEFHYTITSQIQPFLQIYICLIILHHKLSHKQHARSELHPKKNIMNISQLQKSLPEFLEETILSMPYCKRKHRQQYL